MYDQTIPRRIRARREERRLAGYELAKMADISPSYLSLIESGRKLPSQEVAERLARALGDDPDLYRAWVETADDPDLDARQQRLEKIQRFRTRPVEARRSAGGFLGGILHRRGRSRSRETLGVSEDRFEVAASAEEPPFQQMLESSLQEPVVPMEPQRAGAPAQSALTGICPVPLLGEGTDPAKVAADDMAQAESISIVPSLIPEGAGLLFGYRVTERAIERVSNLVRPGDILVFAADPGGVDPAAIYAVRFGGKIVLSRIVYSAPTLLLTGSDPYQDPLTIDVGDESGLLRALAGVVIVGIRTWPMPPALEVRGSAPSLGRSGKLEDGNIVRDCEWRENYGWRPVQKAEDMDYLDAHPGTTVQFRLLRDGEVRFVLEMDAEQWREALGSYYARPTWRRNGYIVAITRRVDGVYTEEFQERWASYVTVA